MATQPNSSSNAPASTPRWVPIAGALVGVAGLAWAIASHFIPKSEPIAQTPSPPAVIQQKAEANGGTAVNASGGARVGIGVDVPSSPTSAAAVRPSPAVSQSATAGSGGTAVNASDAAEVQINKR